VPLETAAALAIAFIAGVLVTFLARRSGRARADPELRAANANQSNTDEELVTLLDQLDVGVMRLDSDMRISRVNRAAARLLETEPDRLANRSLMEAFIDHRVEESARIASEQGSSALELAMRHDEGRRLAVRFRKAPDDHLWLFLEDVTELRRLQRIRSEFIDNLSHELRTPLTTIRLLTETLTQDLARPEVDVPPRMRERILKIDVETGHLVQMVNELLDLSRIEGGAAELHFDKVRMPDVINAAIDRLRTFADRQRVGLETEGLDDDLPPVLGDEERLGQVLVNLLHNAVKFSPPESAVILSAKVVEGEIAVTVRDEGPGVAKADVDRIFERFYKVDKARQRGQGGTGLGLSIARHIVEGHGGRIWVESEDGRGSAFTFTVPLADDDRVADDHGRPSQTMTRTAPERRPETSQGALPGE
jgi:two-component system, OmpR family, phosphate regulon sensor histidine kinase PhoR